MFTKLILGDIIVISAKAYTAKHSEEAEPTGCFSVFSDALFNNENIGQD
ncbi:MAG: hypothetical protein LBK60_00735 [Verrucomicrobiales bacterium]|nr:hypothetical protein [Verrucomicrobiales bacterium]